MNRFALAGAVLKLAPWAVAEQAGTESAAVAQPSGEAARSVVVRAQSLIDRISAAPRSHVDILIRGNRIVEVAPAGDPLADVSVLKSVQFVMKDGAVFKSPPNAAPAP